MALSKRFPDKPSAVAGIAAVREYAGMGLVTEVSGPHSNALGGPRRDPAPITHCRKVFPAPYC